VLFGHGDQGSQAAEVDTCRILGRLRILARDKGRGNQRRRMAQLASSRSADVMSRSPVNSYDRRLVHIRIGAPRLIDGGELKDNPSSYRRGSFISERDLQQLYGSNRSRCPLSGMKMVFRSRCFTVSKPEKLFRQ